MDARKQGVGSAVKELQSNIAADRFKQTVVAHSERVFGAVAIRIPTVDSSRCAGIGRDKPGDGEDVMAIFAAARP